MLYVNREAAPGMEPEALLDACTRRGLAGVELAAGADAGDLARWCAAADERGLTVASLAAPDLAAAGDETLVRTAAAHGVPVTVPGTAALAGLGEVAGRYAAASGTLLLAHGTRQAAAAALLEAAEEAGDAVALAWEVHPDSDPRGCASAVVAAAGPRLRLVRLYGGGPEAHAQTGLGLGTLMGRLALARYGGPIVLSPSRPEFRTAWKHWLQVGRGWGCGSRTADDSLVTLVAG
jgi:hypothetical protein